MTAFKLRLSAPLVLSFASREPYEIRSIEIAPENASMPVTLTVNGQKRLAAVDDDTPLLWVLRDELELTGTKYGCGIAQCGACTVYLDGAPTRSCVTPVSAIEGKELLPVGSDHVGHRAACRKPQADRSRHRRRDERQHLPLRHL